MIHISVFAGLAATISLFATPMANAYDVETHAQISNGAWTRFLQLRQQTTTTPFPFYNLYRLEGAKQRDLAFKYWDIAPSSEVLRFVDFYNSRDPNQYEFDVISRFGEDPLPQQWLLRGVVREDDIGRVLGLDGRILAIKVENPFDDPYFPTLSRPFNHFFDPAKNRPLTAPSALMSIIEPNAQRSPDWALGFVDSFLTIPTVDPNRRNHFSFMDAREAMWRAITGRRNDGSIAAATAVARKAYWATTFRALGSVFHHIQDMAQPQHTRNDSHAGIYPLGSLSDYETRMRYRSLQKEVFNFNTRSKIAPPVLGLGNLPPVTFNRLSDFFSTSVGAVSSGKGMADYSNRNFFTIGTNLGANDYTLPTSNVSSYAQIQIQSDGAISHVLIGPTTDLAYDDSQLPPVMLTAYSAWDQSVTEAGGPPVFTLNDEIYDDIASRLIPRAVGYSAGLLDYFFRGTLVLDLPPEKVFAVEDFRNIQVNGFRKLKVMVSNTTRAIIPPGESASIAQGINPSGRLVAVLTYRKNSCLAWPSLDGAPVGVGSSAWAESCRSADEFVAMGPALTFSSSINSSPQPVVFDFTADPLPWNAIDVDLQVIYRGQLGAEQDGIAVGFYHINEPTYLDIVNFSDCEQNGSSRIGVDLAAGTLKLPSPRAAAEAGWSDVVSYPLLTPGKYARVGFLTQSAFREAPPHNTEVHTNQDFGYDVQVTYTGGEQMTWSKVAPIIRGLYEDSRRLASGTFMKSWYLHGSIFAGCASPGCNTPQSWAKTCQTSIPDIPEPVTILFP